MQPLEPAAHPSDTATTLLDQAPTQSPSLHASVASSLCGSDFHPTEEAADDILAAYVDPDQTLAEIARRFKVSLRALVSWLNHPDTIAHIQELQHVNAQRNSFIAAANQRLALNLLISIIEAQLDAEANIPLNTQNPKALAQRDRARAAARLAASQLIRLAGLSGTGALRVPPVHSAQGPNDPNPHTRRIKAAHQPHFPQPQSGCRAGAASSPLHHEDASPSHAHPLTSSSPHPDPLRGSVASCLRGSSSSTPFDAPPSRFARATKPEAEPDPALAVECQT